MNESRNRAIIIAVGVVLLAVVAFALWRGTGTPTPTVPPGQTLDNPLGATAAPAATPPRQGGVPKDLPPGIPPGMGPAAQQPGGAPR